MLPVEPFRWRDALVGLFLHLSSWAALVAWQFHAVEWAAGLYVAFVFLRLVLVGASFCTAPFVRLVARPPWLVQWAFRASAWGRCGVLAWADSVLLLVAMAWSVMAVEVWRFRMDEAIAWQEVSHG